MDLRSTSLALLIGGLVSCSGAREPRSPSARFDLPEGVPRTSTTQVTSAAVETAPSRGDQAEARAAGRTHDRALEQEVGAYLGRAAVPPGSDVRVTATPGGLVVLSGSVPTATAKRHALEAAARVRGVTAVVDRL